MQCRQWTQLPPVLTRSIYNMPLAWTPKYHPPRMHAMQAARGKKINSQNFEQRPWKLIVITRKGHIYIYIYSTVYFYSDIAFKK